MSADCFDSVVLFKSVSEKENEDDDAYYKAFLSANFQVTVVPVLDFEFINLDVLLEKLKTPHDYAGWDYRNKTYSGFSARAIISGIIFSSPRVATGVKLSIGEEPSILEKWKDHKHFVVGEKTAQTVESLGIPTEGKETGNSKNLAKLIGLEQHKKPFLYPKGSLTKDNFKLELKENQITVDDLVIYKTKPHSDLKKNIINIKSQLSGNTVYFVYFSPSGLNFTLPLLRAHEFDLNQIKFIAIGQTTAEGLQEKGLKVAAVSSKPDPQALLNAVLKYKKG